MIGEFFTAMIAGIAVWKIGMVFAASLTIGALTYAAADTLIKNPPSFPSFSIPRIDIKPKTDSKDKDIAPSIPKDSPKGTPVYRYGGIRPVNLTPSQRDVDLFPKTGKGLSFSTIPKPGAAMTTIEALNATGVVRAVQDGAGHVSVHPIGGTLEDWHNAGSSSVWTTAVKSVVVKWDGVN